MVTTVDEAIARAESIGFPLMVKASEGGGGKGIRKATNMEEDGGLDGFGMLLGVLVGEFV